MDEGLPWISVGLSVLMLGLYEALLWRAARQNPQTTARSAHAALRAEWVAALSKQPGSEILAVQALRNSLMSATITGSTAVVGLMGAVSLVVSGDSTVALLSVGPRLLRVVLELALMLSLFAAFVCSAIAMRYYHHTGFVMSMPVGSPARLAREPVAVVYIQRAGVLYSWSLRCFLLVAPLVAGLLSPLLMPIAAAALLGVLRKFDRMHDLPSN